MPVRISERVYQHRERWRHRITEAPGLYSWAPSGRDETEARYNAELYAQALQSKLDLTVGGIVDRYLVWLRGMERAESTLKATANQLHRLLAPVLGRPAAMLTPKRAKELYAAIAATYAADTHRKSLDTTRSLWTWAESQDLLRGNPWREVRAVGKLKKGKSQLTIDEARKLIDACVPRALTDDGAVVVLMALLMAMRSSEITARIVRDVDNAGKQLRIPKSKTEAGRRAPSIPDVLQPALRVRMANRRPEDLLLPSLDKIKAKPQWVESQVTRLCKLAGVPVVCPHALRGQTATMAVEAGALPHMIAALLGHASPSVTMQHYATPESQERAEQARRLRHLRPV